MSTPAPDSIPVLLATIHPTDDDAAREAQRLLDNKTKPRKSLGRLEALACQFAAIRNVPRPALPKAAIVVMAADHGVAAEGVSAYPQEVTAQMVANFDRGGAAINVLAAAAGADLRVIDMGVKAPVPGLARIESRRVGAGTASMRRGPAMSQGEALAALQTGLDTAADLAAHGYTLVGLGEMGIGNTTAASAITAALLELAPIDVTGRGTGIAEEARQKKADVVREALAVNRVRADEPLGVLAAVGGFEIAALTGLILGCAANRIAVVADGFITGAAVLVACRLQPHVAGYIFAAHESTEPGHRLTLDALGLTPLLRLDMRLGEGTGGALAIPIIRAAVKVLNEMATFEAAAVSDTGK